MQFSKLNDDIILEFNKALLHLIQKHSVNSTPETTVLPETLWLMAQLSDQELTKPIFDPSLLKRVLEVAKAFSLTQQNLALPAITFINNSITLGGGMHYASTTNTPQMLELLREGLTLNSIKPLRRELVMLLSNICLINEAVNEILLTDKNWMSSILALVQEEEDVSYFGLVVTLLFSNILQVGQGRYTGVLQLNYPESVHFLLSRALVFKTLVPDLDMSLKFLSVNAIMP
jgi:hypothetical protein